MGLLDGAPNLNKEERRHEIQSAKRKRGHGILMWKDFKALKQERKSFGWLGLLENL